MENSASLEQVVELEQHFIDSLNPNLNVDLVASSSCFDIKVRKFETGAQIGIKV